jgi:hypothetical protein
MLSEVTPLHKNSLTHLSDLVHSEDFTESRAALEELASSHTNDGARILIDAYTDCQWRDTRLAIIRALGRNGSPRAVEFLIKMATRTFPTTHADGTDTGLCQESLLALGDTRDSLAATFLRNKLAGSPTYLKSWFVNALSRIPDVRAARAFRTMIHSKECEEHPQLLRNILLALSEIRDTSALTILHGMLLEKVQRIAFVPDATALSLLSAIARLSRQKNEIDIFERPFESDLLHRQFFQQCQTQLSFRQQWTLEDYLGKIFSSDFLHPTLAFELNSFPIEDLTEALSLFSADETHFERLCVVISASLHGEEMFNRLIQPKHLSDDQWACFLKRNALQEAPWIQKLCTELAEGRLKNAWTNSQYSPLIESWLHAVIVSHDQPLETLWALIVSDTYKDAHARQRIEVINAFVRCTWICGINGAWPKKQRQLLTELLHQEESNAVQGRWMRALGEIQLSDLKLSDDLRLKILKTPELRASALMMLEHDDGHRNLALLSALQPLNESSAEDVTLFLRACAAAHTTDHNTPPDALLMSALTGGHTAQQLAALRFLQRHPRSSCLDAVVELCTPTSSPDRLRVAASAIVALRSFDHNKSIKPLEACLLSTSKVLSGRALDALLVSDNSLALDIVVNHLIGHLNQPHVCDKILRCIKTPKDAHPALASLIENALSQSGGHSALKDDLRELSERLTWGRREEQVTMPSADVIRAIDEQLELKIIGYQRLANPVKASLRSAELPLHQPKIFDGSIDTSTSVVQYCKALDLTLEADFGQKILFPKMEQQLHIFQNILLQAELDSDSPNINQVIRSFRAEHVFDLNSFPANKLTMISKSILNGRILRDRTQVIDGLKAWALLLLLFSGHERLWGSSIARKDPLIFPTLAQKLISLQDQRNPAAHRQTMMALAPLSEIRKDVFHVFALLKKVFE